MHLVIESTPAIAINIANGMFGKPLFFDLVGHSDLNPCILFTQSSPCTACMSRQETVTWLHLMLTLEITGRRPLSRNIATAVIYALLTVAILVIMMELTQDDTRHQKII